MIPTLTLAFEASGAVLGHRIVRFSEAATTRRVAHGAANTDALIGVADRMGGDAATMVDVHLDGIVDVALGGTVAAGAPLTSDAAGLAIASVAGAGRRIVGFALEPGVSGDIIKARVVPGFHSA